VCGVQDVLINNAGVVSGKTLLENTPRAMNLTMQVNTISHFWTVRKLLPGMLERDHGRVVTIASAAGTVGTAGLADYCASKFGAFGFGEALRMELRNKKSKVRTTLVCPNFIRTPLFEGAKTKWPLILPILEPDYVAAKVIKAIKRDQPLLIMPRFTSLIFLTRGLLPVSWFDYAMDVLGISKSMDHFCGKSEGISK
jgi:all-trans-retinol dehydrogenase (NAD+)